MNNRDSIFGLLLRAHACAAVKAVNERDRGNISAASCYEAAQEGIEAALHNTVVAEQYVHIQEAVDSAKKQQTAQERPQS